MYRRRSLAVLLCASAKRDLILRPGAGPDPQRFPLGYVPLDGSEPLDAVYTAVKRGNYVCPVAKIETIHNVYLGIGKLVSSEFPALSPRDYADFLVRKRELLHRVLIPRQFWTLEDFNDPELNSSFGIQNLYFDNYKWSQFLWKRFQLFVEEYFPLVEHTHLTYGEYCDLIRSYAAFEDGVRVRPLLPRSFKLHPPFGVPAPNKLSMEPLLLLKNWIVNSRKPLHLQRALCLSCGSGTVAFMTKLCGVPMVSGVDPSPIAIEACRKVVQTNQLAHNISFQVAELFPTHYASKRVQTARKYDLIIYYPDQNIVSMIFSDNENDQFAPGATGYVGSLEAFFEVASEHLSDTGVIAIACTNIYSLLFPFDHHPIEYEIKVNRRFVLLDYYDAAVQHKESRSIDGHWSTLSVTETMKGKLRSELWILHKLESIGHFASVHGIPTTPRVHVNPQPSKRLSNRMQKQMRKQVELMGGSWPDYKKRLAHMLQEQSDVPEDDVAAAVRMALDPSYPEELAERARQAMESSAAAERKFQQDVMSEYAKVSPREAFDNSAKQL